MQIKLTIGERLKDLRVVKKLTLEQLAVEVGISKSALGKYESDNGKDISPYSRWRSQPLSRVSRKQRYNTLDFAEQNRVPRWTLSPLETSQIFCVREYPNCKITVGIPRLENKKGQNLIPQIG